MLSDDPLAETVYHLPEVLDSSANTTFSVEASGLEKFMSFDNQTMLLTLK